MLQSINIGPGTNIDQQDLLETRLLVQSNSGGGKSGIVRVILEESNTSVPFILFDKKGEYYTLKEKLPDVIIIGGPHADIPLTMEAAKLLPRLIIENRLSVIIDMSGEGMNNELRASYIHDFLKELMNLPQKYWIGYYVIVEEAHLWCGQQDKLPCGKYVKELMSEGRKMGYCGILVTQRISKLHKDAAAEANNKFIGRTFLDLDMDRSASELGIKAKDKLQLRDLKKQHFFAFGTAIHPHYVHEVVIKDAQTDFPKAGSNITITIKKPTDKILKMLTALSQVPVKATKTKPADTVSSNDKDNTLLIEAERKIIRLEQNINQLKAEKEQLVKHLSIYVATHTKCEMAINNCNEKITQLVESTEQPDISIQEFLVTDDLQQVHANIKSSKNTSINNQRPIVNDTTLAKGEQTVLTSCAQYKTGLLRTQITVLTGYKLRTRNAYIQALQQKKYVEQRGDKIFATQQGISVLGKDFKPLPTGEKLRQYWLSKLPAGERSILVELIRVWPNTMTRKTISDRTNYSLRTRNAYIQQMKAKEIVEYAGKEGVRASDFLFTK